MKINRYKQVAAVVMAAGKGTRMNAVDLPKVMVHVDGRPMIDYVLESVGNSAISQIPVVVVGYWAEKVRSHLGESVKYAMQEQQLGTGHAVACAKIVLEGKAEQIMVLNGDHPTVRPETVDRLIEEQIKEKHMITMATVTVKDFGEWRAGMARYGRVVRDEQGRLVRIVEEKDATEGEKQIKELNSNYFCFQAEWLWEHVDLLGNQNAQNEFYLTDLLAMAIQKKVSVGSISIAPAEALGINTMEELVLVEELLK